MISDGINRMEITGENSTNVGYYGYTLKYSQISIYVLKSEPGELVEVFIHIVWKIVGGFIPQNFDREECAQTGPALQWLVWRNGDHNQPETLQ